MSCSSRHNRASHNGLWIHTWAYPNRKSPQMNVCLALKRPACVVLPALTQGLVKYAHIWRRMSGHVSVHHTPQHTTRMTVVCKNSRKTWICLWASESGAVIGEGRSHASVSCELLWRPLSSSGGGSLRHWWVPGGCVALLICWNKLLCTKCRWALCES